jgi:hypothetical protein
MAKSKFEIAKDSFKPALPKAQIGAVIKGAKALAKAAGKKVSPGTKVVAKSVSKTKLNPSQKHNIRKEVQKKIDKGVITSKTIKQFLNKKKK